MLHIDVAGKRENHIYVVVELTNYFISNAVLRHHRQKTVKRQYGYEMKNGRYVVKSPQIHLTHQKSFSSVWGI